MATETSVPQKKKTGSLGLIVVVLFIVIAFVIALGVVVYPSLRSMQSPNDSWRAVFLTNGQVYFGHMYNQMGQYVTLKDIYYLDVSTPLQASDTEGAANAEQDSQIRLIKLGEEIHGPKDTMQINRDHILFIEDLKEDSKVVQSILQNK
jgi:hypothetical protein